MGGFPMYSVPTQCDAYGGNGYCDEYLNNFDCDFDKGDCCECKFRAEPNVTACLQLLSFPSTGRFAKGERLFPGWITSSCISTTVARECHALHIAFST